MRSSILSFVLVEPSRSSVISVVVESTAWSFAIVLSDFTMFIRRASEFFITDGLLRMRRRVTFLLGFWGLCFCLSFWIYSSRLTIVLKRKV
jgi:hypothetical protein